MTRVFWFLALLLAGLLLVTLGLFVPAHFRAVDARVLAAAGERTPSVAEAGLALLQQGRPGAAQMLLRAVPAQDAPGAERLQSALQQSARVYPQMQLVGVADANLQPLFRAHMDTLSTQPVVQFLLPRDLRASVVSALSRSTRPLVTRLLAIRAVTNTVHFAPVSAAGGEALDVAIALTALLAASDQLHPELVKRWDGLAKEARWGDPKPMEGLFLDLITLGRRMSWGQLIHFLRYIPDVGTMHQLAESAASHPAQVPVLFAAVHLAETPTAVGAYIARQGTNAVLYLGSVLQYGQGGVRKLLASGRPPYHARARLAAWRHLEPVLGALTNFAANSRPLAIALKLVLLFDGAFLLAMAGTYLVPGEEYGRRLITANQLALTATLLVFMLVWSEPFLLQQPQALPSSLYWKFPMAPEPVRAAIQKKLTPMAVDFLSIVSLSFFLLMQLVIYIFCRRKLAEIQRENLSSRLKLRLLENEEHLFDAGLYWGFVGTVLSLVALSLGILKASLMAAYSSTSFGIIFVSILKIFYLRPYRKKLILDTEGMSQ